MNGKEEYYMTLIKELEGISSILTGKEKREFKDTTEFQNKYEEEERKVNDLTIIVRSYTSTEINRSEIMLDQNKERIFKNPKIEYTLRTINSLINSCNLAIRNFKNLEIKLIITDDNSSEENLNKIKSLLNKSNFKNKIIHLQKNEYDNLIKSKDINGNQISQAMVSNMRNILKSIFLTKTEVNDLVYFVEDDYIHKKNAIDIDDIYDFKFDQK